MFPLNLSDIGADYYTGNCHKWLCAPFGSGFLHVRPERRAGMRPLIISWGKMPLGDDQTGGWPGDFEWLGTRDFSPFLATSTALDFFEHLGIAAVAEFDHELARYARSRIAEVTGLEPACPDSAELYGAMCAHPMPPGDRAALQDALWHRYAIEVPVVEWNGRRILRTSSHVYNTREEIDRLAAALKAVL
jgi:isopenicillin-N epimerase